MHIPANPDYSSLNLAAAVQVVCYELRIASLAGSQLEQAWDWGVEWDVERATAEELNQFFEHMETTLIELGCINPHSPRQLMKRMKRLYMRSRPDQFEVGILRGVFSAIQKVMKQGKQESG